jgi:phosphoglycolate phosphatase
MAGMHATDGYRPVLVLWDIDHTLIDVGPATRDAYARAFRAVAGRPLEHPWSFDGRTELAAAAGELRAHGIEPDGATLGAFLDRLAAEFEDAADDLATGGTVLPGAVEALRALAERPGVYQSVLTGNLYPVAALKLARFGLAGYLDLRMGAYGGDAYERTDLPAHAFARARRRVGLDVDGAQAVIIGDTPRDVATARAAGARAVAVATGSTSLDDLAGAGADVLLPDLRDTAAVVRAVTGS